MAEFDNSCKIFTISEKFGIMSLYYELRKKVFMLLLAIIGLVVTIIIICWFYGAYVSVIKKRNKTLEAFSSIDVQLKKRYDLIPNLVAVAKGYMEYEKTVLEKVSELRAQAMRLSNNKNDISKKINLNNQISDSLGKIMMLAENYPNLKSDNVMINLMQNLTDVEEHIAAARRFYNSAVNEINNAVEIFPSNLVAMMMGIKTFEFFQAKEAERQNVSIK